MIHKSILIKSDGFYLVDWDPETGQPISETRLTERLSSYFGNFAEFDNDVTVGDLLLVIGEFVDEINLIFNGYLNEIDFDMFLQEAYMASITQPAIVQWGNCGKP